jgi:hypothetical protein
LLTLSRNYKQEIVQVLVGEKKTAFSIHKHILVLYSAPLARACQPNAHGEIQLPDVSEEIFSTFQKWLCMHITRGFAAQGATLDDDSLLQDPADKLDTTIEQLDLDLSSSSEDENYNPDTAPEPSESGLSYSDADMLDYTSDDDSTDSEPADKELEVRNKLYDKMQARLLDLYVFAVKYEVVALRNDVLSAMHLLYEGTDYWTGLTCVPSAFARLPASSMFCQFLIKHTACWWNGDLGEEDRHIEADLPTAFLLPIMQINSRRANGKQSDWFYEQELFFRCNFHEHASGEEKRACWQREAVEKPFIQALVAICKEFVDAKGTGGGEGENIQVEEGGVQVKKEGDEAL